MMRQYIIMVFSASNEEQKLLVLIELVHYTSNTHHSRLTPNRSRRFTKQQLQLGSTAKLGVGESGNTWKNLQRVNKHPSTHVSSTLPSKSSKDAPPPVETKETLSSVLYFTQQVAVSPPPITVKTPLVVASTWSENQPSKSWNDSLWPLPCRPS